MPTFTDRNGARTHLDGLGFIGCIGLTSEIMYNQWGITQTNIIVGLLLAVIDNVPVMFSVLIMEPSMPHGQRL